MSATAAGSDPTAAGTATDTASASAPIPALSKDEAEAAIERFCHFLSYETVSRTAPETGAYRECAHWLVEQLKLVPALQGSSNGGDDSDVFLLPEAPEHSPVVVARWRGSDESLPVILLNSHYDVVPVTDAWTRPAWGHWDREAGRIYGRGTQDMKSVCMQYLEAIRQLSSSGFVPTRTVYLTFVPDEEIGGAGMAAFLDSDTYRSLPGIALALDEGLASTSETLSVFYGERIPWFVQVTAKGPTGHGSRFIDNTAVEQLLDLCQKALQFRRGQRELMGLKHDENCAHAVAAKKKASASPVDGLGEVTSLNVTALEAGVKSGGVYAYNCVPPSAMCALDIRIAPTTDPAEIGAMMDTWCRECSKGDAGTGGLTWEYLGRGHDGKVHHLTSTDTAVNPWYGVFCNALRDMGLDAEPQVFPAASDSRFLRALGIRALGFSPMRSTPQVPCEIMLHEVDEYIPAATFLEGIGMYINIIRALASQGADMP